MRVGSAACATAPLIETVAPSAPGQVAATTVLPALRSCTQSGSAVGSAAGPVGLIW